MINNRWNAEMRFVNDAGGSLIAVGDVTLDNVMTIKQVKLMSLRQEDGQMKNVVCLPRKKVMLDGEAVWKNIFDLSPESRRDLELAVYDSVKREVSKGLFLVDERLKISVKVNPGGGNIKGKATLSYDGMVTISNIHIMQGKNGLFVSYPSSKSKTGEYAQLFQPINRYSGEMLGSAILNAYEDCVKKQKILESQRPVHKLSR